MAGYAYTFPWVVVDWTTRALTANRDDGELLDPDTGLPVEVLDNNGLPTSLRTGPFGILEPFTSGLTSGIARFGEVRSLVISDSALDSSDQARSSAQSAQAALDSILRIEENAAEISYLYRDANGDVWVSDTPVVVAGGRPRIDEAGDVWVDFVL